MDSGIVVCRGCRHDVGSAELVVRMSDTACAEHGSHLSIDPELRCPRCDTRLPMGPLAHARFKLIDFAN